MRKRIAPWSVCQPTHRARNQQLNRYRSSLYPRRQLRALAIKAAINPFLFYARELPTMPTPKREHGWTSAGLCVFHKDRHEGSFHINLDSGAFTCFACGCKGADVIAFTQRIRRLSFREALRWLAREWRLAR